jgi:hypothetical protein
MGPENPVKIAWFEGGPAFGLSSDLGFYMTRNISPSFFVVDPGSAI